MIAKLCNFSKLVIANLQVVLDILHDCTFKAENFLKKLIYNNISNHIFQTSLIFLASLSCCKVSKNMIEWILRNSNCLTCWVKNDINYPLCTKFNFWRNILRILRQTNFCPQFSVMLVLCCNQCSTIDGILSHCHYHFIPVSLFVQKTHYFYMVLTLSKQRHRNKHKKMRF